MAVFDLSFNFSLHTQFYGALNNEICSRFICTAEVTSYVSSLNMQIGPEHIKAFFPPHLLSTH